MELEDSPTDRAVLLATKNWLERAVIGLGLCPFAKAVHAKEQIRYFVSPATTPEALLVDLRAELLALSEADPELVDTTVLVTPHVLADFFDYNDFLEVADALLSELGLSGELQIASFHPDYLFGEHDASDPANNTNRSPFPILHLLREASVERAVEAFPDAREIFEQNLEKLRALGHDGYQRVLAGDSAAESLATAPTQEALGSSSASEFGELGLSSALVDVLRGLGFEKTTKIQAASIPVLLAGKDLVGQSKTGSGKTAAFALPILERMNLAARELQGLILCPTRELSAQVAREFRKLGRGRPGLSVVVLSGGEPIGDQSRALARGVHVAIGTPGRVLDHLRRRTLRVHRVGTVVLDEADRMLDMGFQPDIEKVLKALPSPRQTGFFSATFPDSIRELSAKYQQSPVWVTVEQGAEEKADIRELVLRTDAAGKLAALRWALEHHPHESALVFANLKATVARIEKELRAAGMSVASLHGDLEQRDRDRVMAKFRNGSTRVLVATDVAARGIDLQQLDLVVNVDLPDQPEVYVHRIGRTGRAGRSGLALSICAPEDAAALAAIEQYTGSALTAVAQSPEKVARRSVSAAGVPPVRDAAMDTLRIAGGRKDKLRPGDILGALTGQAGGMDGEAIGKIEIHERFSFVAVKKAHSQRALESLREGRIKGRRFRVERVQ